jgi:hypothetical protein
MGRKSNCLSRNSSTVAISTICILLAGVQSVLARPAEIILLRHAEKPQDDSNVHLSTIGKERARALVQFFTNTPALTANGLPVALFAARPLSRSHSRRPEETLGPLAKNLRLHILTPHTATECSALAKTVLNDPAYDGRTVVICWVHDYLPQLADALGVKPKSAPWKSNVFDRVWVITYRGKEGVLNDLPQRLLPGDALR